MRTFVSWVAVAGVGFLMSGCGTTPKGDRAKTSVAPSDQSAVVRQKTVSTVGMPLQKLFVQAAREDARIEFFLKGGGSVSIDNGHSQDNYAFGVDGKVIRHKRSAGDSYAKGAWEDVKPESGSAVGVPVATLVTAAVCAGARVEFFLADGGSVSVHTAGGQENYAFGTNGLVTGHKRSMGENYAKGVWETVAP